ncbi:MAG: ATP-binding protein [Solirubrobacterales bacterium]
MVVCPVCGEENPARSRFCLSCGAPLGSREDPASEERKLVTVVFSELVGLEGGADPEELKHALDPYYALVRREVGDYGGTVDKFMGPTALSVFGAPVAHEDDPERALRVALNVRDAMSELAPADAGPRFGVRFGVNTGEAIVARLGVGPQIGEAVTGDVVNTASRLQQLAAPGELVVGEETFRATEFAFAFEELDPVEVKGKAEPVRIWRVLSARSRFGVDLRPRPSTPFVGRREEREMLEAAFRRAVVEQSTQLVTITGEPGIGKTRLVQELARFVDEWPELVRWRQGRSLPYGEGVGHWALGEIVKAEAGILESDAPDVVDDKLSAAVAHHVEVSERDWVRARLAPLVGVEGSSLDVPREELFTAWRRFLEAIARNSAVFVFEDLQWADDGMLAFIEHLVDWAIGLPMLVVCVARPELYERHPAWGGGRRNATSVALSPLSEQETSMLLSALLGRDALSGGARAVLLERAGGNPLYAEEFARMVRDAGLQLADGSGPVLPQTLHLLIGARLDSLGAQEKAVLQDAAVVGKVFWTGTLAAMAGSTEEQIERSLEEAVRREFVRPIRGSSVAGQAEYAFLHALVQDVAYGQIPRAARAAKHVAVAAWIRDVAGDRVSDLAEVLAHHYGEALELARTSPTGLEIAELETAAGGALMMAGDRAKRLDPARALPFYRRAREVLAPDDPERIRALVEAAEAAEDLGQLEDAGRDFDLAIAEARQGDDRLALGEALARRARSVLMHGESARALLAEAIAMLEAHDPGPELARAYAAMAGHLYVAGEDLDALPWAGKALALADELGMDAVAVLALQYRGAARAQTGDPGGLEDLREALRRGLELGLGAETSIAYNNLAYQLWFWEGPGAAQRVWDEMAVFCRVRGFQTMEVFAQAGGLESSFDLGEWDRVLDTAEEMLAWDLEHGPTRVSIIALIYRGWVRLRRGDVDSAATTAEELLPLAREIGYAEYVTPPVVLSAEIALARGDAEGARARIREFAEITHDQEDYRTMFLPVVARVLVAVGDVEELERLLASTAPEVSPRRRLSAATARAILAEARGDLPAALDGYREAVAEWGRYGFGLERAMGSLGVGRVLVALERGAEAGEHLDAAAEVLRSLGAVAFLEEVEGLRRAVASP